MRLHLGESKNSLTNCSRGRKKAAEGQGGQWGSRSGYWYRTICSLQLRFWFTNSTFVNTGLVLEELKKLKAE